MIRHTKSDKVHVAGRVDDHKQRCARCGAQILDNSWQMENMTPLGFWESGALVLKRRSGARVVSMAEAMEFRMCGRVQ